MSIDSILATKQALDALRLPQRIALLEGRHYASGTVTSVNGVLPDGKGDVVASGAIGEAIGSGTAGSVLFVGTNGLLAQNNANFFWRDTGSQGPALGIGTITPGSNGQLEIASTTRTIAGLYAKGGGQSGDLTGPAIYGHNATGNASTLIFRLDNSNGDVMTVAEATSYLKSSFGIGITAPTSVLHVVGTAPATVSSGSGTNATQVIQITGGAGGATTDTGGFTGGTGATLNIISGSGGNAPSGSTNGNGGLITIQGGAAGAGAGTAGSRGNITLNPSGGNVGIGTAAPANDLHVNGQTFVTHTSDTAGAGSYFLGSSLTTRQWSLRETVTNNDFSIDRFNSSWSNTFTILNASGNVGIGTTNPQASLQVGASTFSQTNRVITSFFNSDTNLTGSTALLGFQYQMASTTTSTVIGTGIFADMGTGSGALAISGATQRGFNTNFQGRAATTLGTYTGYNSALAFTAAIAGTVTNFFHFYAQAPQLNSGAIGTAYGIRIDLQKQTGVTTGYGVYQNGATDNNFFAGNVGIGANTATPNSTLQVNGNISTALSAQTGTYAVTATDSIVTGDATGGAFTITLPTAASITGRKYTIKKIDASANAVTIGTTSAQTIDGAATYALSARWKYASVVSDGANWLITANN